MGKKKRRTKTFDPIKVCQSKRRYSTYELAKHTAELRNTEYKRQGLKQVNHVYKCKVCEKYHLTTSDK